MLTHKGPLLFISIVGGPLLVFGGDAVFIGPLEIGATCMISQDGIFHEYVFASVIHLRHSRNENPQI